MKNAHIRDAMALIEFAEIIESEMGRGNIHENCFRHCRSCISYLLGGTASIFKIFVRFRPKGVCCLLSFIQVISKTHFCSIASKY